MSAFNYIVSAQTAAEERIYAEWDKGYITQEESLVELEKIRLYYADLLLKENERISSRPIVIPLNEVYDDLDVDSIDF
jgi:hypothetical protein